MSTEEDSPKIIVDSDWKAQVAKEKEAASSPKTASQPDSEPSVEDLSASGPTPSTAARGKLPPANFETLLSMLFTQAMSCLGQIPDPSGDPPVVDKPLAKHTIDTLDMLVEKTKGNLSDEESKMLGEVLHALRMAFVSIRT